MLPRAGRLSLWRRANSAVYRYGARELDRLSMWRRGNSVVCRCGPRANSAVPAAGAYIAPAPAFAVAPNGVMGVICFSLNRQPLAPIRWAKSFFVVRKHSCRFGSCRAKDGRVEARSPKFRLCASTKTRSRRAFRSMACLPDASVEAEAPTVLVEAFACVSRRRRRAR